MCQNREKRENFFSQKFPTKILLLLQTSDIKNNLKFTFL